MCVFLVDMSTVQACISTVCMSRWKTEAIELLSDTLEIHFVDCRRLVGQGAEDTYTQMKEQATAIPQRENQKRGISALFARARFAEDRRFAHSRRFGGAWIAGRRRTGVWQLASHSTTAPAALTSQVTTLLPLALLIHLLRPLRWILQGGDKRSNSSEVWHK